MGEIKLKPCPFCGVSPTMYCDITNWRGVPVYKRNEQGYRPKTYVLKAEHKPGCYIRVMNGTNSSGESVAFNWEFLVEAWNRRAETC
jgi:hypothetical protein